MAAWGMTCVSACPPSSRQVASWLILARTFMRSLWSAARVVHHGQIDAPLLCRFDGQIVPGIGMAHHSRTRIGSKDPAEPPVGYARPVSHSHHPGMNGIADADTTAVVKRDPARATGGVQQRIQQGPIGDRVGAILHSLRLAIG